MQETSELQALDFALGASILSAFQNCAYKGPANWIKFLQAEPKDKIFRIDHEDSLSLIKALENKEKTSSGKASLPVVAYFRKPGLTNGDLTANVVNKTMFDEQLSSSMRLSFLPVAIDYSMTFAAWDMLTLDKMQIAWYAHMARNYRANRFIYPVMIDTEVLEVPVNFVDPKTVIFSDTSPPKQEAGRIYSVSYDFTVNTQLVVGEAVTVPDPITVVGICSRYLCVNGVCK